MNTFTQPFYRYSRRNKRGHRPISLAHHVREKALDLWFQQFTLDEIACTLQISIEAIKVYVRKGREQGDERAADRRITIRELRARARRRDIIKLNRDGMTPREIAEYLNVGLRLVQTRLKEAGRMQISCQTTIKN